MGACLATNRVAAAFGPGNHGTTFGGNPLAMAVGNAVLDVMLAPGFMEHVVAMGDYLGRKLDELLARYPAVYAERRGKGLIQGLKCHLPNTDLVEKLRSVGLLTVGAGDNVIRLLPPLIITETEIDKAARLLADIAAEAKAT
jgi:acetylornithine/N-succinyldiaminopimelate aminotransferase